MELWKKLSHKRIFFFIHSKPQLLKHEKKILFMKLEWIRKEEQTEERKREKRKKGERKKKEKKRKRIDRVKEKNKTRFRFLFFFIQVSILSFLLLFLSPFSLFRFFSSRMRPKEKVRRVREEEKEE